MSEGYAEFLLKVIVDLVRIKGVDCSLLTLIVQVVESSLLK